MKTIKKISLALSLSLGLSLTGVSFAQSLADQYGVSVADTVSGTTAKGLSYTCGPSMKGNLYITKCTYGDGIVVTTDGNNTAVINKDGSIRHFSTNEKLKATLEHLDYTVQTTVRNDNLALNTNGPIVNAPINWVDNSSSNGGSGSNTGAVVAGVTIIGAGIAIGSTIGTQEVLDGAKAAAENLTKLSATGIEGSMAELNKISDAAGAAAPKHDLRFGPTPTGDVFSFCSGPRPGRHNAWRYWWDYLCSHGQSSFNLN